MPEDAPTPALTVWRFTTAAGAGEAARTLGKLPGSPVDLGSAAVISWAKGTRTPRVEHFAPPPGERTLDDPFWGLFFGLVFFMPLFGAAIGGTTGTTSGTLADLGIDDTFINKLRDRITPGSSGLFVLTDDAALAAIQEAWSAPRRTELLYTHLTTEQVEALRAVFGTD